MTMIVIGGIASSSGGGGDAVMTAIMQPEIIIHNHTKYGATHIIVERGRLQMFAIAAKNANGLREMKERKNDIGIVLQGRQHRRSGSV
mmetsp:Transcript_2591/g.4935  ORF Transcript_2591/g.4935 Transcript_2591/m.4935 type:complete len:88 (-) Transcript_2591:188-451(-)